MYPASQCTVDHNEMIFGRRAARQRSKVCFALAHKGVESRGLVAVLEFAEMTEARDLISTGLTGSAPVAL